ncbi:MAG: 2-isopropylmalate synthase, partial [Halomonas sp.]
IVSVHPHNDRGTGVAAAELTLMAGADRVEGTLFGNGERTGNVDIVTLAMNMYTQGVHPQLDFSNITPVMREVEYCNQLPVHPRHPYVGDLVFTAFSGSHQDAIKKGMLDRRAHPEAVWDVPYLPIDPLDVGRSYEAVIRVNSQSGKGGVSYLLEQEHGIELPRRLSIEFSQVVQEVADRTGKEITSQMIYQAFADEYLEQRAPFALVNHRLSSEPDSPKVTLGAVVEQNGERQTLNGEGNGPLAAFVKALAAAGHDVEIIDYHEHSRGQGADAEAIAYVEVRIDGKAVFGVGNDESITSASMKGVLSAINRHHSTQPAAANVTASSLA